MTDEMDIYDPEFQEKLERELQEGMAKYEDDVRISYRKCAEFVHAKRMIYELIKFSGIFSAAVPNEEKLAHAEGRRLMGLHLKGKLDEINPELFYEIMTEGTRYEEAISKVRQLSSQFQHS